MAWLTLTNAAALLRMSYNVILRKVLVGDLRGERRDGHWFVDANDLDRLLAERNAQGKSRDELGHV